MRIDLGSHGTGEHLVEVRQALCGRPVLIRGRGPTRRAALAQVIRVVMLACNEPGRFGLGGDE